MPNLTGFVPPPYPYERIDRFKPLGERFEGGLIDLSIGTPCDPPPAAVIAALAGSDSERGYPSSPGSVPLREAVVGLDRPPIRRSTCRPATIAACVGTKEFVGTLPQWLKLRRPDRDTILYPAISYPTYEMGAILAGCRPVPVPLTATGQLALDAVDPDDASRALALWVNSPGNPTGALDDLDAAAAWGRARDVPVFSDECYVEFTWDGRRAHDPRTRARRGGRRALALQAFEPRRRPGRLLCRRSRPRAVPAARSASTSG